MGLQESKFSDEQMKQIKEVVNNAVRQNNTHSVKNKNKSITPKVNKNNEEKSTTTPNVKKNVKKKSKPTTSKTSKEFIADKLAKLEEQKTKKGKKGKMKK